MLDTKHSHGDAARDNLLVAEAAERARRVSNVRYSLDPDLTAKSESYRGTLTAEFEAKKDGAALFIDFTGKQIVELTLNGEKVASPDWNKHRIGLPDAHVKGG